MIYQQYKTDAELELANRIFSSDEIYQIAKAAFEGKSDKLYVEETFASAVALTKALMLQRDNDILSFIGVLNNLREEVGNKEEEAKIILISSIMFNALNKENEFSKKIQRLAETAKSNPGFERVFVEFAEAEKSRIKTGFILDKTNYGLPSLDFSPAMQQDQEQYWDVYRDLLCQKIEDIQNHKAENWLEGNRVIPKNSNMLEYNDVNSLMMLLHCEKKGYELPLFLTIEEIVRLNYTKDKQGKLVLEKDMPKVGVRQGEEPLHAFYTPTRIKRIEDGQQISVDEYNRLSLERRAKYHVLKNPFQTAQFYPVYNVEQTNLKEVRPELYKELAKKMAPDTVMLQKDKVLDTLNKMLGNNDWMCPFRIENRKDGFYLPGKREIISSPKEAYLNKETFFTNLFHSMASSMLEVGAYIWKGRWYHPKEDLMAELTAAVTAQRYGMSKAVKPMKWDYLQDWIKELKRNPLYVKDVLLNEKKAAQKMTQEINRKIAGNTEYQRPVPERKEFYASIAYLQFDMDTEEMNVLKEKGNYKGMLNLADDYYCGDAMNEEEAYHNPCRNRGDEVVAEDEHFAIVYNNSVGGTYDILLKYSEQQMRDHIIRYGAGRGSEDVKALARRMTAEEFDRLCRGELPYMNNRNYLLSYNEATGMLEAGKIENNKWTVKHIHPYNEDYSLSANIKSFNEQLEMNQTEERGYSRHR